jgi:cytidylate kinase
MAFSSGEVRPGNAQRANAQRANAQRGTAQKPGGAGAKKRAAAEGARTPHGHGIAPCIAITHEASAGATAVAERVAEQLGYTLWGSALTARVAHRMHVPEHALRGIEERAGGVLGWLRDLRELRGEAPSGAAYRVALSGVVSELCGQGGSVILGRGAALLVRPEQALRVRIVCPLELRIARHARRLGLELAKASREVRAKDRAEARFLTRLVGHTGADEGAYDLVLSTGELALEAVSRLVVQAYNARFALEGRAVTRAPAEPLYT